MAQTDKRTQYDLMHPIYEAIANSDMTAPQAHLLLTLYKFMDGNGTCYPSYNTLQRYTKMSRSTLCKHINSLKLDGWISYEQGSNAKHLANTYQLNLQRIGITQPEPAEIIPINQPKQAQYIALDGTCFDYPTAMHEHNAKLRQSK